MVKLLRSFTLFIYLFLYFFLSQQIILKVKVPIHQSYLERVAERQRRAAACSLHICWGCNAKLIGDPHCQSTDYSTLVLGLCSLSGRMASSISVTARPSATVSEKPRPRSTCQHRRRQLQHASSFYFL